MNRHLPLYILCMLLLTALFSCVGTAPTKEVRFIDSLNRRAYAYRYKNLDSSYHPALEAYNKSRLYNQGKAEACNNLGFCAFMKMDFERAEGLHKEVYGLTKNELELLIATDENLPAGGHEQRILRLSQQRYAANETYS